MLLVAFIVLARISHQFDYETPWVARPTYLAVMLMMVSGAAYLLLIYCVYRTFNQRPWQVFSAISAASAVLLFGLLLRLIFIGSTPIFEDDFYRYFFDGAMVSEGLNPYLYAPQQALSSIANDRLHLLGVSPTTSIHPDLSVIAQQPLVERVAYPHIKTIYPPLAQAFFTASYQISPFELLPWRCILLLVDCVSVYLILVILKTIKVHYIWCAVYWLNPIVITETINAGHMDVLLLPFVLGTILLAIRARYVLATVCLACAVGVKLWPVILAPVIFRPLLNYKAKLVICVSLFLVLVGAILSPQLIPAAKEYWSEYNVGTETAGLVAYAQEWRTNSWLFGLIEDSLDILARYQILDIPDPQQLARLIAATIVLMIIFCLSYRKWSSAQDLLARCLWLIACLFLISPASYPWYLIWFLPFLSLVLSIKNVGLLLLTLTLPLYDLRYPLMVLGEQQIFAQWITMLQFLPVILLCLFFYLYNKKKHILLDKNQD
jgi:hypothetical protein